MTLDAHTPRVKQFDVTTWSDAAARGTLQLIAESVAQMVRFEVANISAVLDGILYSVAIEGGEEVKVAVTGLRTPIHYVLDELELADDWGRFKFVPHERMAEDDPFRWIPEFVPGEGADAWHPHDALLAPLYSVAGDLQGLLSIDLPISGARPDATQRNLLERYAAQAERALQNAFEREALAQRLRLTEAARRVVQLAVSRPDIDVALDECRPALLDGFRADDVLIRTYGDELAGSGGTAPRQVPERLRQQLRELAHTYWASQRVAILHPGREESEALEPEQHAALLAALRGLGHASGMLVPLGVGSRCLGHLILLRSHDDLRWTTDEQVGALEVARDIGHAVLASRNLMREQRLVAELRELDTYKTQLLSTVSHELKNPLGAITGHLELVVASEDLSRDMLFSLGAMGRATTRITRVVEDLLTLAKLEDPDARESAAELDLCPALVAAVDSTAFLASQRGVRVSLELPDAPLLVSGTPEGLERVFANLVSNAVKYTPRDGSVTLEVATTEIDPDVEVGRSGSEVVVSVTDEGIGISAEDQAHLFDEFFRSTNPAALAEPGTGLGLAISARIVETLGGRIEVDSILGEGSTFRVVLPAPRA
ncbi:ATP-binding protein [Nocardioides sp.]|uniref:ATP-binding protein n=1 Tax=Nocardioides sp. TaxID=35761 RepID=UPI002B268617|nr:ATP-binding protein [Nocardioides sp.]